MAEAGIRTRARLHTDDDPRATAGVGRYLVGVDKFELVARVLSRRVYDVVYHGLHLLWQRQAAPCNRHTPAQEYACSQQRALSAYLCRGPFACATRQCGRVQKPARERGSERVAGPACGRAEGGRVGGGVARVGGRGVALLVQQLVVQLLAFLHQVVFVEQLLQRVVVGVEERVDRRRLGKPEPPEHGCRSPPPAAASEVSGCSVVRPCLPAAALVSRDAAVWVRAQWLRVRAQAWKREGGDWRREREHSML